MADIFDVVADETRRDILGVLRERSEASTGDNEISVSEIVAVLAVSQPTVSKHLRVLRDAGLVIVREEGQHRFYRLETAPLEDIEDWLIPFLATTAAADAATLADAEARARAALNDEQRAIAAAIGKAFATTAHQVSSVVAATKAEVESARNKLGGLRK